MNDKKDMTRIEDLSEYLHEDNDEVDQKLAELPATPDQEQHTGEISEITEPGLENPVLSLEEEGHSTDSPQETAGSEEPQIEEMSADSDSSPPSLGDLETAPEETLSEETPPSNEATSETPKLPESSPFSDNSTFAPTETVAVAPSADDLAMPEMTLNEGNLAAEADSSAPAVTETTLDIPLEPTPEPSFPSASFETSSSLSTKQTSSSLNFDQQKADNDDSEIHNETHNEIHVAAPPAQQRTTEALRPINPERFDDVRKFAQNLAYGPIGDGGHPPYAIVLRNIKYKEDCEDILALLGEVGIMNKENQNTMEKGLEMGHLLISQISEYAAVYLAHRFRRYDLDITLGLADEIHPPKHSPKDIRTPVNKENYLNEKGEYLEMEKKDLEASDVILATTPFLEGRQIVQYLGVATSFLLVEEEFLNQMGHFPPVDSEEQNSDRLSEKNTEEISENNFSAGPEEIYQVLANDLKAKALKMEGNAVVGVTYQMIPLINRNNNQFSGTYKINCTGNVVWANPFHPTLQRSPTFTSGGAK